MAGYFDNMGTGPSSGSEFDYARNGATNPGAVPATGFYDRLFGHKGAPGGGKKGQPPVPLAPSGNPAHTPPVGQPNISSGAGLIKRIMTSIASPPSFNSAGQPLVPGMNKTVPELLQTVGQGVQSLTQRMAAAMPQNPPAQSYPPQVAPTMPPRGPMPSAGAPGPQYTPPPMGGAPGPQYQPPMPTAAMPNPGQQPGFFSGGHYARGGYPQLMTGMPMRHARGDYVPDTGHGDGRSDNVNAKLSPGEYVMDGETVALLGNGNNDAGARKLDEMRHNLRVQKGKALAEGRFSPDAKDPMHYVKGHK